MNEHLHFGNDIEIIGKLGEGSFAEVFEIRSRNTGRHYAVKRLKQRFKTLDEAQKLTEISALKAVQGHPNVIHLYDVLYDSQNGHLALVMELFDQNLYEFISSHDTGLNEQTASLLIYQLLKAISYMHSMNMFHRDIKPENCMIKLSTMELKLVDFGSTREEATRGPFTEYVSTRWYRAPECILTSGSYGPEVDLWAVGCIFFELLTTRPLFPGKDEIDQINRIHNLLGSPSSDVLSLFERNPNTQIDFNFPKRYPQSFRMLLPYTSRPVVDLIKKLLVYDPLERITAEDALMHPAFDWLRALEEKYDQMQPFMPFSVFVLNPPPPPAPPEELSPPPPPKEQTAPVQHPKSTISMSKYRKDASERIKKYNATHKASTYGHSSQKMPELSPGAKTKLALFKSRKTSQLPPLLVGKPVQAFPKNYYHVYK